MKLARRSVLAALAASCATPAPPTSPQTFVYDDVNRYNAAVASIAGGADPVAAMQSYIDAASEGLRTWIGIYPFTAQNLADERAQAPRYYSALSAMPQRIAPLEPEITRAYAQMEAMAPNIDLATIYFVVGNRVAGGTARAPGTLVAVEMFGAAVQADISELGENARAYDLNELAQVVIHEGAHNLQRQIQGEPNYISIYVNPQRMTLRNFAIREGVADYITHLVSGRRFEPRHAFAEPREAEIWAEFAPLREEHITAQPGWFTGRFADGRDWPIQVGYFVGYKMAEHLHRGAADPAAALIELLSPNTDEQFRAIAERYAAKFA